jgi:hypothetical protein
MKSWPKPLLAGIALIVVGTAPLLVIITAASLGLLRDPNPNPIGPGLLFFFTFWPAAGLIAVGLIRLRQTKRPR